MKKMDDILKQALTPTDEPDFWLNQKILLQAKEVSPMKKMNKKKFATVALSCAFALGVSSVSIYAAWKYLTPDQVIMQAETQDKQLAEAFSGENAIYINETQSYGGYDVTLLGLTSGKNLSEHKFFLNDVLMDDRTFAVLAVEANNPVFDPIYDNAVSVFPVVEGHDPEQYTTSVFISGSGSQEIEQDGTLYIVAEFNNVEIFADQKVHLCVSDDIMSYSEYSYIYDDASGTIARNEDYIGLNALFSLPLDPSKADPEAVKKLEAKTLENKPAPETDEKVPDEIQEGWDFVDQLTPENIDKYATPVPAEDVKQAVTLDGQGRVYAAFHAKLPKGSHSSRCTMPLENAFPDGKNWHITGGRIGFDENIVIEYYQLNDDGTVTLQLYWAE